MQEMEPATTEMQEMARAMQSMAEMCQMMMQREAAMRPYMMAGLLVVGGLLVIALVLLIVLQTQWIRFWQVRIKTERLKLT
jgi:hypothetical protein